MMKNKNILLITLFSLAACILHAAMLQTPFTAYLYTSIAKVIIFISFPALYCAFTSDGNFKDMLSLFSMHGDRKNLRFSLLLGLGTFTFIVLLFTILLPLIDPAVVADALAANSITYRNAIFVFLYIVVINAALEQFFFRGFVFLFLHRKGFKRYAHGYSAVLFAVYHIPILFHAVSLEILILCTVGLTAAGLIFNALTLKCRGIGGSLIVHISANLALNLMIGIHFVF